MEKEICVCGHHTNDHSYVREPETDINLYCDLCNCFNFSPIELPIAN